MSSSAHSDTWGWYTVILLWVAGICAAMQFAKMSVGLVSLQAAFATDATSVTTLMAATGLFGLVLGVSGASISNALGLRRILLGSLFAAAVLSLLEALIPSFAVFYWLRLLEGLTNLFIVVAAPTLIAFYAPRRHLPMAMSIWGSFYGVAFALSGLAGPTLLASVGISGLLACHGLLTLAVAVLLTLHGLRGAGSMNTGEERYNRGLVAREVNAVVQAYRNVSTALPGLIFFFHSSLYLGFLIFIPLEAKSQSLTETLLVTMPLASIAGTLFAGPMSQFLPASRVLVVGFLIEIALVALLVPAATETAPGFGFGLLAHAIMLVSGLLQGSIFIMVPSLASNPQEETLGFGVIAQLGSLGSIIGPTAFAASITHGSLLGFAWLVALAAMSGSLVAFIGIRHWRSRQNESELLSPQS